MRCPERRGSSRAREALELVSDGSNSPMESVLCALLTWPRRLGGYALGPVSLNHRVSTADGDRYVDVAFPGHKVGLEYKGRKFHAIEQAGRDDRRQNKLVGSGWTILNVWYEDIVEEHLYNQLVADVARAMGIRLRIRSGGFDARRQCAAPCSSSPHSNGTLRRWRGSWPKYKNAVNREVVRGGAGVRSVRRAWGLSQAGHWGERTPQDEARARLQDLHLATGHGDDRGVVRGGGDAGAQGWIHRERDLGQVRLDGEGVADHADVGA